MAVVTPTTTRQIALYEDTCDIWKPDALSFVSVNTGEPSDTTYSRIAQSQPCYYFTKTETAAPEVIGRYPSDIIYTLDILKLPAGVDIDDTYIVKLTTTGHDLINTFWIVIGEAQRRINRTRRHPAFAQVYLKRLPKAPPGVS